MEPNPPVAIESLLSHRAWVRGLAHVLAAGPADPDDLEQEAWLAGIRRGAEEPESPRGWLAAVLRRQAARAHRGEGRRVRRQRAVSRTEATPSTAEVVERTETHRRIVEAVLALAEPHRTTVLLRFFEDLPPREVARRMAAPVETVRSRLRRALLELRERFDREETTGRRPWRAAFLALVTEGPSVQPGEGTAVGTAAAAGGLAMTATAKTGLGIAVAIGLSAIAWFALRDPEERSSGGDSREIVRVVAPATDESSRPELAARGDASERRASAPAPEAPLPADRPSVRVVAGGAPGAAGLADASVVAVRADGGTFTGTSDASGRVVLSPEAAGTAVLWVSHPEHGSVRREGVALAAGREERIALEPGAEVRLRFVEMGTGRELPADEVRRAFERSGVEPRVEIVSDGALTSGGLGAMFRTLFGPEAAWRLPSTIEWADGGARLAHRLASGAWRLLVWTPGGQPVLTDPYRAGSAPVDAALPIPPPGGARSLRFVDAESGAPLPMTRVRAFHEFGDDQAFLGGPVLVADARGEILLPEPPPRTGGSGGSVYQRPPTWWAEDDAHAGRIDDPSVPPAAASSQDVRLWRTAVIQGRAYTSDGKPATGRTVVWFEKGHVLRSLVDADARFRIERVPTRGASTAKGLGLVEDLDQARITMVAARVAPGETTEVVIGKPAGSGPRARIEGRITAGGEPLVGVFATARTRGEKAGTLARSEADGRFVLDGLAPGTPELRLFVADPRVSDDFHLSPAEPWTLSDGETRPLTIELPGGTLLVKVVDAATGAPIAGAAATARPPGTREDRSTVPGWTWTPGDAAFVAEDGSALLRALPFVPLEVAANASGYASAETTGVTPGARARPTEIVLRLSKKP